MLANAAFGEGTGRIWMSGLTCGTTQLSLFSCSSTSPVGSVPSSCRHADDASVRCQELAAGSNVVCYEAVQACNMSIWMHEQYHFYPL